ncbi:phosphonate C-P lyase system protein PhnG [Telmatospirillum sp.]|uniref:phosphonate C-P lyase system protein PhnG n=1 Tax=Telmatospirillum sp. TaxID=2079197 RepID=UPI00284F9B4C|nr:phosphonate C-P lyase system protein PhnG [Telmatospirillum sp.]MDR3440879.1 phosphonate C-P lyase system protein PhnG [Telmatospirillum sp.]
MVRDATSKDGPDIAARRRWMSLLARAPVERLEDAFHSLSETPAFVPLRKPEIGSVLVRARAGGAGQRFNLGEMTVTRCSVRLPSGLVGHAYVAGRRPRSAELAALFDALMQDPSHRDGLARTLIEPLATELDQARRLKVAKTAASKVTFFTMARGED